MAEGIKEVTHGLLQSGSKMKTRAPDQPSPVRDTRNVYDIGCEKRKRSDVKGVITRARARAPPVEYISTKIYKMWNQQKAYPWRKY